VPLYAEALLEGTINAKPKHGGEYRNGLLYYEGDHGLGQTIGASAMRQAMKLAEKSPVVPCLLRECGHLAALGAYVLIAAEAGMFALICQATTPLMGLPGWKGRGMGNNPIAFATPLPDGPPLVFDMASSVVARGHLRQAVREKVRIPEGWAIGPDGEPTTDPEVGFAGAVLPVGGYKGIGIAMMIQCLAGSLIGSSKHLRSSGAGSEMGAFLMVINPKLAVGDIYAEDVREWFGRYMAAAGPDGRYPGRRAAESEVVRRRDGIPVPPGLLAHMRKVAERLSVPLKLPS
jgi:LDH2 family malate/lactate/ureidoglycolate dehydrogenase